MINKIKSLCIKYKDLLLYAIFGVLTTLVNLIVFFLFDSVIKIDYLIANIIAWIASVLFAYVTNRIFVFNSKNKNILKEFLSFIVVRLASLGLDMLMMFMLVDLFDINSTFSKIVVNILVIIINYVFSKLFIFKKEEDTTW